MLDIGIQELLVVMVIALLVFGPDRLPELGRRLGRAMREFRRASDEFRQTVETNLQIHEDLLPPSAAASAGDSPPATEPAAEPVAVPVEPAAPVAGPAAPGADGDGALTALEPFWTSRGGRLLHRRECSWRGRVADADRIPVKTAGEGFEQGLRACPACDPREEAAVPS
jgi:TatA/E family protein of Tat protein translocase